MSRRAIPRDSTGVSRQVALASGEILYDAAHRVTRVGDAATPGGVELADRRSVPLSLIDGAFAALGVTDFSAAATAMFAAGMAFMVPTGAYAMATTPVMPEAGFSWHKDAGAQFSGAGTLTDPVNFAGFTYTADLRYIQMAEVGASAAAPSTISHPVAFFSHHTAALGSVNPATVFQQNKWGDDGFTGAQAAFFETVDRAGNAAGRTDFAEGIRSHGQGMGASGYGGVLVGQVGDGISIPTGLFAAGLDAESIRTAGVGGKTPLEWTAGDTLDSPVFATLRLGVKANALFMGNPYNVVSARVGFLVANSRAAQGPGRANPIVDFASFATIEEDVSYGLFIRNTAFCAISIPNNQPIMAQNADNTAEHSLFYYSTDNHLVLADGAPAISLRGGAIGFNGAVPIAKPTTVGSRSGNSALASLIAQLAIYGLITDGTTA